MIRHARPDDLDGILNVATHSTLFEHEEMEVFGHTIREFFAEEEPEHVWLVDEHLGAVSAVAYMGPEMADRVWNLFFISVLPELKGMGRGGALLRHVEAQLVDLEQRMLVIDTSGLDGFEPTRAFYIKHGYTLSAQIPDFWADGDDKVVFTKRLS